MPPEIHDQLDGWLASAICSGSFTARKYLEATNPDAALAALQQFRDIGGYSIPYLNYSSLHALHAAAVHGTRDDVLSRLAMDSNLSIEDKTVDGETPLYIACARGCWEIAAELLNRGADASVRCTRYGITCLHWLFAFEPTLQPAVITGLIKAGADVNAIVTESIPFYHFPFYLPGGSPLDWAVVTASDGTVEILLQHGADPALRDASTPYAYDRRITTIDSFGGPHQDGYSADMVGMGLSSLDYAALYHESCIFECLRRSPTMIDINAADNEGLTVLHRLSSHHIHYTRKLSYSFIPFRGDQNLLKSRLARTVAAIKALGGDLDKLTTPLTPFQYIQGEWRFEGLTPLMLATLDGNYAVAQALVDAGADVDKETDYGNTALHMSSAKFRAEDYAWDIHVAKILVEAGATVHRENKLGHTPLCLAAGEYGGLERFELFLQNGGDIGDTDNHPGSAQYRLGVFSLMARPDPPFDESRDLRAASLLEEFLFSNRDVKKRDSVISHVNENGETMLHRFAAAHMRHSIDALLRHGVPALVFARIHTFEKIQGEIVDVTRAETPLDRAIEAKEEYERDISKAMRHSLLEFEDICKRADAVIGALKAAGCQRCKSLVSIIGPEPLDGARPWVA
jgi:ankyrin repeat protein